MLHAFLFWLKGLFNPPVCEACGRRSHSVHPVEGYRYACDDEYTTVNFCSRCAK